MSGSGQSGGAQTSVVYISAIGCMLSMTDLPRTEDVDIPEPVFSMSSAVWQLDTLDLSNLPDITVAGNGYAASVKNIASNNLCINYVTAGVKNKTYALSVTNTSSIQGDVVYFPYKARLASCFITCSWPATTGWPQTTSVSRRQALNTSH